MTPALAVVPQASITVGDHPHFTFLGLTFNSDTMYTTVIAAVITVVFLGYVARKATSKVPNRLQIVTEVVINQTRTYVEDAAYCVHHARSIAQLGETNQLGRSKLQFLQKRLVVAEEGLVRLALGLGRNANECLIDHGLDGGQLPGNVHRIRLDGQRFIDPREESLLL